LPKSRRKRVQLKDHSICGFCPKDNPKNRHFSGKWWIWSNNCGPIASLMIEKYLRKITRTDLETRILKN
jgi:hypothetical protein